MNKGHYWTHIHSKSAFKLNLQMTSICSTSKPTNNNLSSSLEFIDGQTSPGTLTATIESTVCTDTPATGHPPCLKRPAVR